MKAGKMALVMAFSISLARMAMAQEADTRPIRERHRIVMNFGGEVTFLLQPEQYSDHDTLVSGFGHLQLLVNLLPYVAMHGDFKSLIILNLIGLGGRGYLLPGWLSPYADATCGVAFFGSEGGPDSGPGGNSGFCSVAGGVELSLAGGFNASVDFGGLWLAQEWKPDYGHWKMQLSFLLGYRF